MADLLAEVGRFREWANAYPLDQRYGEWECDYDCWTSLYDAVLDFVDAHPFQKWSAEELSADLYAVARDNEIQHIAGEIRCRHPATLLALAAAATESGEPDTKWQLAEELGHLEQQGEAERLLLILAHDADEYVRRRSLVALARTGSPAVEELALLAWHRPDDNQQWARMMALWCLHHIGSPHLDRLLAAAEQDERPYLSGYAKKLRQGQIDT